MHRCCLQNVLGRTGKAVSSARCRQQRPALQAGISGTNLLSSEVKATGLEMRRGLPLRADQVVDLLCPRRGGRGREGWAVFLPFRSVRFGFCFLRKETKSCSMTAKTSRTELSRVKRDRAPPKPPRFRIFPFIIPGHFPPFSSETTTFFSRPEHNGSPNLT